MVSFFFELTPFVLKEAAEVLEPKVFCLLDKMQSA